MARRRSRTRGRLGVAFVVFGVAGVAYWWTTRGEPAEPASPSEPIARSDQQHPITKLAAGVTETPSAPEAEATVSTPAERPVEASETGSARDALAEAERLIAAGDPVGARQRLVAATAGKRLPPDEAEPIRARLYQLADETIFSRRAFAGDPLTDIHVLGPGEVLLRVGRRYKVSPGLLAMINGLPSANRVRQGQRLKVVNGPFHAVVDKGDYDMFVYLQDTLVRHFKVGLGVDGATPTGTWRVSEKLTNPTYYPPRGGKIIPADDPENPLGERWIGLEGIDGAALGQTGYGIHGTIEPETIGTSMSLGCIRLLNEDVEFLFNLLVRGESTVVIRE